MSVDADTLRTTVEKWLRWYASSSQNRKIVPWLIYFPHASQVKDSPWGIYDDSFYKKRVEAVSKTQLPELLKQLSEQLSIRYVDLTPALRAFGSSDLYLQYDTHPTAKAYRIAAKEIGRRFLIYQNTQSPDHPISQR